MLLTHWADNDTSYTDALR